MKRLIFTLSWLIAGGVSLPLFAQRTADSTLQEATLQNVIQYALTHQAAVQQALIDENITEEGIKTKLADWYPQVNFNYNFQNYFHLPAFVLPQGTIASGTYNQSGLQLTATQNLFNRDVLLASRTKGDVRTQAKQNTVANKITVTVNVSKAFYDVLATTEQIKVSQQDIIRLESSLKNAKAQYEAGITDKTDFKRATIALNNSKASLATNTAQLKAKTEYLKFVMGYPVSQSLNIMYDSLQMEREVVQESLDAPNLNNRIEYQQLLIQRKLMEANVKYEKMSFIPTAAVNAAYNYQYLNDRFSKLYSNMLPNSFINFTVGVPIFQGGKRTSKIRSAEWSLKRTDWDIENLKNSVNSEYNQTKAAYNSYLANYVALKENVELAQEVYDVIQLQYQSGVKAYLEVINAESDLRTARINYYNALYQVLASKVDVQRALGQITY